MARLHRYRESLFPLAVTGIVLAYFLVWLPQPVVGLSFIGLEMGEWVKFIPQVQSGEVLPGRNLFYLPPVTSGLMLAFWTADWPNRRSRTWLARGLAVLCGLLAFPALEAIRYEPGSEWQLRLGMVGLVVVGAGLSPLLRLLPGPWADAVPWGLVTVLALIGSILPTWAYLAIRPAAAGLLGEQVGIGPGVWLNLGGHFLAGMAALLHLRDHGRASNMN
jgi:hypothetical protein